VQGDTRGLIGQGVEDMPDKVMVVVHHKRLKDFNEPGKVLVVTLDMNHMTDVNEDEGGHGIE